MAPQVESVISGYLEKLQKECHEKQWAILQTRKPAIVNDLEAEPPEFQIAFLKTVLANAGALAPAPANIETTVVGKLFSSLFGSKLVAQRFNWLEFRTLGSVASNLLRRKLPFHPEDLTDLVRSYARYLQVIHSCFPVTSLISAVESGTRTAEIEGAMRGLRDSLVHLSQRYNSKENRKLLERIDHYLEPRKDQQLVVGGLWSAFVFSEIEKQPELDRSGWSDLFAHCLAAQSSTPSKAWRKRSEDLIATVGVSKVRGSAIRWLNSDVAPVTAKPGTQISDKDADYLKGFVWMLGSISDGGLCQSVADVGLTCLRKIPNIGPVSARVGFACVNTLAEMPGMDSVAQLTRMRAKVKYAVALKLIEKALNAAAERAGLSRDDLEDMAVPTYGLGPDGQLSEQFGECKVDLTLVPGAGEIELQWKNAAGKLVKSPPAEVKQNYGPRLKEIKRTAVDAQKMLSAQRLRIEQFFINERKIKYEHWSRHFLDHPLLSAVAKRLIWRFESGSNVTLGAWLDRQMVGWNNEPVAGLGPGTMVELWHPLQSDPQTILSWRCWLEDHHIVQPLKQAHREVYLLTPAEEQTETYSNRFAAHVIRQHQFASLCRERGWQYRLMGSGFDGHNVPTLDVPRRSVKAEFWVDVPDVNMGNAREATDQMSGAGINLYLLTDQVRFYRDQAPVRLAEISQVVFSEIMRDVDLFVGVTSIGNDPTWADRGDGAFGHQYWQSFAFGDLSQSGETRRTILEKLLPQLKIGSRCTLDGKFLVVRGDLHTYKIHLGSANILMEPGSHYLCIVPDRGHAQWQRGSLYLPFDGDQTLAIILSKAFLLAADSKITDSTILRQIGRPRTPAH
jgi:Domain of unknown function (DUF4132)